jgi:hypothetical protein
MIPVKAITSVTTAKDGLRFTKVQVVCSGNTIDFRVSHGEAKAIRELLTDLTLGRHSSQQQAASAGSGTPVPSSHVPLESRSVAAELDRLAELKQRGVLTEEEFRIQKTRLLG